MFQTMKFREAIMLIYFRHYIFWIRHYSTFSFEVVEIQASFVQLLRMRAEPFGHCACSSRGSLSRCATSGSSAPRLKARDCLVTAGSVFSISSASLAEVSLLGKRQ